MIDYFEIIQRNSSIIKAKLTLTKAVSKFKFKKLADIYPKAKITPTSQNAAVNVQITYFLKNE